MSKCFVLVPCYNENEVLSKVVEELRTYDVEVVVIDDGSSIDTFSFVQDLNVHFLEHGINLGQGAALQTGMSYALRQGANYIIHFDADGQHDARYIPIFLTHLQQNNLDIVLGSRFLDVDATKEVPSHRRILLRIARWFNWCATGLLLSDAHNGFRVLSRKAAEKIIFTENRMAHATEILSLIKKHRLRYDELPITIRYTAYAMGKGQRNSDAINIVFDILLNKLFR